MIVETNQNGPPTSEVSPTTLAAVAVLRKNSGDGQPLIVKAHALTSSQGLKHDTGGNRAVTILLVEAAV
jgi:hypothetical protein